METKKRKIIKIYGWWLEGGGERRESGGPTPKVT